MLLAYKCFWHTNAVDIQMLLAYKCCWHTNAVDIQIMLAYTLHTLRRRGAVKLRITAISYLRNNTRFLNSEYVHANAFDVNYQHVYNNNIPMLRGTTLGSALHTYQRTHRPSKTIPIFVSFGVNQNHSQKKLKGYRQT